MSAESNEELEIKLAECLNNAYSWMSRNKLCLNLAKTKSMVFGSMYTVNRVSDIDLNVGNTNIELVKKNKYLGVILDSTLTFTEHVKYLKGKIVGRIRMLGKLRPLVGQEMSLSLYHSLILPVLDYADVVYDCLTAKNCHELQKLQNGALRIVQYADKHTRTRKLHEDSKMMYLTDRCKMHTCNEMYKIVNKLAPECIVNKFALLRDVSAVNTRAAQQNNLVVPHVSLESSKRNFIYRGPCYWNMVDLDIRVKPSLASFKRGVANSDLFIPT